MNTKTWVLIPNKDVSQGRSERYLVRATSEEEARQCAVDAGISVGGVEPSELWLNPERSTCTALSEAELIMAGISVE